MPGKGVAVTAALVAVAVWSSSCSAPPPPRAAASAPTAAPSRPAASSASASTCVGAQPAAWSAAFRSHRVTVPGGTGFTIAALSGDAAFGQSESAAGDGVAELDLATGRLTTISTNAKDAGGLGALAVDGSWVVWEQLDSQTNPLDWSVHAWNRATGVSTVLSVSRAPDGSYPVGQQPIPVIRNGVAAWAQPVPAPHGTVHAELRLVDLNSGRRSTLATGAISSPVFAGPYLVWGAVTGARSFSLQAVEADTLRQVPLPAPLQHPDSIGYLAGSAHYLAWSDGQYAGLTVWPVGSARTLRFTTPDTRHHFQFLQLAGHFVLWYSGAASSVLDLDTGDVFDVPGTVAGSERWIAAADPPPGADKGATAAPAPPASTVSVVSTDSAPAIADCAK